MNDIKPKEYKSMRLGKDEIREIEEIVSRSEGRYQSFSHFARLAIKQLIKKEKNADS